MCFEWRKKSLSKNWSGKESWFKIQYNNYFESSDHYFRYTYLWIQCENKNHLVHFAQVFVSIYPFLESLSIHISRNTLQSRRTIWSCLRLSSSFMTLVFGKKKRHAGFFFGEIPGLGAARAEFLGYDAGWLRFPSFALRPFRSWQRVYRRGGGGLARQEMKGADGRRGDRKIWWRVAGWVGGNVVSSETGVQIEWDRRFEGK